ncbi:MAG: hypothetical protein IJF80_03225 [Clostridia bacterium]|nr:hypothetical protein [Clostridia bacterium]
MEQNAVKTKKKGKGLLIAFAILLVLVIAVVAFAVLFLRNSLSLASAYSNTLKQFESHQGVLHEAGLGEFAKVYEDECKLKGSFEVADVPKIFGDSLAVLKGAKLEIESEVSYTEKKTNADMKISLANVFGVDVSVYADEEKVQIELPMLFKNVVELENENIYGQLKDAIPLLGSKFQEGGKIRVEKFDLKTEFASFKEEYKDRLEEADKKITVEDGGKTERLAFGGEYTECKAFTITLPPETVNGYALCLDEYLKEKGIGHEVLTEALEELKTTKETFVITVHTANDGFLKPSLIVGLDIQELDKDDKLEISFMGKDNVFENMLVEYDDDFKAEYTNKDDMDILSFESDGESVKIVLTFDEKIDSLKIEATGGSVNATLAVFIKRDKNVFSFEDIECVADLNGEKLTFDGSLTFSPYEGAQKLSETPDSLENATQNFLGSLFSGIFA